MVKLVSRLLKSRLLIAVVVPLAARAAATAGRSLEQRRGPSSASRALQQTASYLTPAPARRRGVFGRLLGR